MFVAGECVNGLTSEQKQNLYNDNSIFGFKIDFRFVFDVNDVEYDVGAGEAARGVSDCDKMHKDLGKLLREGKDIVDGNLNNVFDPSTVRIAGAPIIQISGLVAEFSTVHLADNGLYIALPQGKMSFPTSPTNMKSFINDLEVMFKMVVSDLSYP